MLSKKIGRQGVKNYHEIILPSSRKRPLASIVTAEKNQGTKAVPNPHIIQYRRMKPFIPRNKPPIYKGKGIMKKKMAAKLAKKAKKVAQQQVANPPQNMPAMPGQLLAAGIPQPPVAALPQVSQAGSPMSSRKSLGRKGVKNYHEIILPSSRKRPLASIVTGERSQGTKAVPNPHIVQYRRMKPFIPRNKPPIYKGKGIMKKKMAAKLAKKAKKVAQQQVANPPQNMPALLAAGIPQPPVAALPQVSQAGSPMSSRKSLGRKGVKNYHEIILPSSRKRPLASIVTGEKNQGTKAVPNPHIIQYRRMKKFTGVAQPLIANPPQNIPDINEIGNGNEQPLIANPPQNILDINRQYKIPGTKQHTPQPTAAGIPQSLIDTNYQENISSSTRRHSTAHMVNGKNNEDNQSISGCVDILSLNPHPNKTEQQVVVDSTQLLVDTPAHNTSPAIIQENPGTSGQGTAQSPIATSSKESVAHLIDQLQISHKTEKALSKKGSPNKTEKQVAVDSTQLLVDTPAHNASPAIIQENPGTSGQHTPNFSIATPPRDAAHSPDQLFEAAAAKLLLKEFKKPKKSAKKPKNKKTKSKISITERELSPPPVYQRREIRTTFQQNASKIIALSAHEVALLTSHESGFYTTSLDVKGISQINYDPNIHEIYKIVYTNEDDNYQILEKKEQWNYLIEHFTIKNVEHIANPVRGFVLYISWNVSPSGQNFPCSQVKSSEICIEHEAKLIDALHQTYDKLRQKLDSIKGRIQTAGSPLSTIREKIDENNSHVINCKESIRRKEFD